MHEFGHTLGLNHEHQHPGRDQGIRIAFENVKDEYKIWFKTKSESMVNTYGIPYDLDSIMHYSSKVSRLIILPIDIIVLISVGK